MPAPERHHRPASKIQFRRLDFMETTSRNPDSECRDMESDLVSKRSEKMQEKIYPLVSIALATYNGQQYLEKQLISLINQDYPNFEIVISDDCSSDNTWSILESYARQDLRIRLLPRDFNRGYVKNFIRAFGECRGQLISPSDQDDIWHPEKTRRLVENMGEATLIYSNNRLIDENDKPLGKTLSDSLKGKMIQGNDSRNLLFCNSICGHAMLFRKDLLSTSEKLDTTLYIDWTIAFLAADKGHIKYLDEVLVDWRQHRRSFTAYNRDNTPLQRENRLRIEEANLNTFSSIKGQNQTFSLATKRAWNAWHKSYLNLSMLIFILKHGRITHKFHSARHPALKYIIGHKLKKILRPNYYEKLD
ncbi:glycosyl transferase 2 family protein [Thauera sp. SWB20]|nr:glycosyl transferase 2 family protein [Thauera sp. SWB20]